MIDFVINLADAYVGVVLWRIRVVGGGRTSTMSVRVRTTSTSALTITPRGSLTTMIVRNSEVDGGIKQGGEGSLLMRGASFMDKKELVQLMRRYRISLSGD